MATAQEVYDVVIVGAGPGGLACAIEAKQHRLKYLVLEKGCLVNSIFRFPTNVILFSTPDLLELARVPFIISTEKPKRSDLLNYYRRLTEEFGLQINLYERVMSIDGEKGRFFVKTNRRASYSTRNVVIATGQYDNPNYLNIPGEDLPKVSHYYTEAHPYYRKKVAVIGGKNSAVEAVLDLYRHGAQVTLIHRGSELGRSVKYWIRPDVENRIKENKIQAHFNTVVEEIKEDCIVTRSLDGNRREIPNDFLFALTGYHPDLKFLESLGIKIESNCTPVHNSNTLETNVLGIYIAGVITAGAEGSKVFIENSRFHGRKIIGHILNGKK